LSKSRFSDPVELLEHLLQQLGLRVQQLEHTLDSLDMLKTALLIGYKTLED
jgi:antitoxin component HigA of HigAB toxin-antitoxin module